MNALLASFEVAAAPLASLEVDALLASLASSFALMVGALMVDPQTALSQLLREPQLPARALASRALLANP